MLDYLNKNINIGDTVVIINKYYKEFDTDEVVGFTNLNVKLKSGTLRDPSRVLVVDKLLK